MIRTPTVARLPSPEETLVIMWVRFKMMDSLAIPTIFPRSSMSAIRSTETGTPLGGSIQTTVRVSKT